MSEPAALDLAAIRERTLLGVDKDMLDSKGNPVGFVLITEFERDALVDDLERCRAERDALREALGEIRAVTQ